MWRLWRFVALLTLLSIILPVSTKTTSSPEKDNKRAGGPAVGEFKGAGDQSQKQATTTKKKGSSSFSTKKNGSPPSSTRKTNDNKNNSRRASATPTSSKPSLSTTNNTHTCTCNSKTMLSTQKSSFFGRSKATNENNNNGNTGIAYLVNAHNDRTLHDAAKLINAISHPDNLVFVHIDTKYPKQFYEQSELYKMINDCPPCGVRVVRSEKTSEWGQWNMNDPVLWAIDELTHNPEYNNFKYSKFITLSGDTYPTLSQNYLHYLFGDKGPLEKYNFVTSHWCETGMRPTKYSEFPQSWHKRKAYPKPLVIQFKEVDEVSGERVLKSKMVDIYYGSQWMMLTKEFVHYMGKGLRDRESFPSQLRDYMIQNRNVVTDETYFSSILMNHPTFKGTVPTVERGEGIPGAEWLKNPRYERMDEHMPGATGVLPDSQRYKAPDGIEPRVWGPYFLGINDLEKIKSSGAIFFRKISEFVEGNLYKVFPCDRREDVEALPDIGWSAVTDYEISERPKFW